MWCFVRRIALNAPKLVLENKSWNSRLPACLHSGHTSLLTFGSNSLNSEVSSSDLGARRVSLSDEVDLGAPYTLREEEVQYVTNGDPVRKLKLDTLLMELFVQRQKGMELPTNMSLDDFVSLLGLSSAKSSKILHRIFIKNKLKSKTKIENKEKQKALDIIREERKEFINSMEHPWLQYRLFGNALFLRFFDRSFSHCYNWRLEQGRQFGQNVVFDCSFNQHMRDYDIKNTAKQILLSLQDLRWDRRPFGITLCNIHKDDRMFHHLKKLNPQIDIDIPVTFSEKNYTDLFPKKDIVYLSPHSRYDLQYSPDHVYIIGALVDKIDPTAHSIARAREDGVRTARFPIDRHITWQQGSKSLCLNQVIGTLLTVKNTGSWAEAFEKNLPSRKITFYPSKYEKQLKF